MILFYRKRMKINFHPFKINPLLLCQENVFNFVEEKCFIGI